VSIVVILLALSPAPFALCQIPQGFNYQAVLRDDPSNNPIVSQGVQIRFTIQTAGAVVVYQETHSTTTDEFGTISLVVGGGTPVGAYVFSDIDWSVPLSLKTEFEYPVSGTPDYDKLMGTTALKSVPYALVAKDVEGPVQKLGIEGATTNDEEALFEVRNKSGQLVFAVYNEGIRAYVNEIDGKGAKGGFAIGSFGTTKEGEEPQDLLFVSGDSVRVYIDNADIDPIKGPKGGFAIGGYGTAKAGPQQFLTVSNDSVRIYVDNNESDKGPKGGFAIGGYGADKGKPQKLLTVSNDSVRIYLNDSSKGVKGGFAIGGFDKAKGDGANVNFFNIETDNTGIVSLAEPRILWYPLKNAFLAGQVLILKPDSVGMNSVATGFESRAKGAQSQAMGYQAIARGDYSTAIGKNALARKANSFAFGDAAKAYNQDSYAFGAFTEAQGLGSFAFGYVGRDSLGPTSAVTKALGNYSFAFGLGAQTGATAEGAFALGSGTAANGQFSLAMGYKSTSSDYYSVAIGNQAQATQGSSAIGRYAVATGKYSFSVHGYASGSRSVSIGDYSEATAGSAIAIGGFYYHTDIPYETHIYTASATGARSVAIGSGVGALGDYSVSIGNGNYGDFPPPPTTYGKAESNYSYAIGNNNRSTATYAFSIGTSTLASGSYSFSVGYNNTSSASYSFAIGNNNTSSGQYSTAMGRYTTAQAYNSFVIGRYNVISGTTGSWVDDEPLFVVGNGDNSSSPSNAFSVRKDGITETGSTLRVTGWSIPPSTGAGVEISYLGEGSIQAYDRSTGTQKPLFVYSGLVCPIANNTYDLGTSSNRWKSVWTASISSGPITPFADGVYDLGTSSLRWKSLWATDGTINTSDRRMKEDIQSLKGGLETVLELNPISFIWKNQVDQNRHLGLVAQEVLPLIPEVVSTGDDPDKTMGINYSGLVPVLISAIKEQQAQIEEMKRIISRMEEKIASSPR